jgi:hypothetical protein
MDRKIQTRSKTETIQTEVTQGNTQVITVHATQTQWEELQLHSILA